MTEAIPIDGTIQFQQIASEIKKYVKEISNAEKFLKSISFSISLEKREIIVYFAWANNSSNLVSEKAALRKQVQTYLSAKHFILEVDKSSFNKLAFKQMKERRKYYGINNAK